MVANSSVIFVTFFSVIYWTQLKISCLKNILVAILLIFAFVTVYDGVILISASDLVPESVVLNSWIKTDILPRFLKI